MPADDVLLRVHAPHPFTPCAAQQIPKGNTGRKLAQGRHVTSLSRDFPESFVRMQRFITCIYILNYYKLDFAEQWQFTTDINAAATAYMRELERALLANLANGTLSTGNTSAAVRSAGG
jgi:hypothetical protein